MIRSNARGEPSAAVSRRPWKLSGCTTIVLTARSTKGHSTRCGTAGMPQHCGALSVPISPILPLGETLANPPLLIEDAICQRVEQSTRSGSYERGEREGNLEDCAAPQYRRRASRSADRGRRSGRIRTFQLGCSPQPHDDAGLEGRREGHGDRQPARASDRQRPLQLPADGWLLRAGPDPRGLQHPALLDQGFDGTGRTIGIVDAYGSPTLAGGVARSTRSGTAGDDLDVSAAGRRRRDHSGQRGGWAGGDLTRRPVGARDRSGREDRPRRREVDDDTDILDATMASPTTPRRRLSQSYGEAEQCMAPTQLARQHRSSTRCRRRASRSSPRRATRAPVQPCCTAPALQGREHAGERSGRHGSRWHGTSTPTASPAHTRASRPGTSPRFSGTPLQAAAV